MNFQSLAYFKTVAEELNITHAAQKLYISQQGLSSQIRKLEDELEVELFSRAPRLALTDAGRCLYEATKSIEGISGVLNDQLNEIRSEIRGELRIGLSFTRGQFILPSVLPEYARENPKVKIKLFEEPSLNLMDRLLKHEIDYWITAEKPQLEGLVCEPLFTERFYLVVPKSIIESAFSKKKAAEILEKMKTELVLEDLVDCPFVLLNPGNRSRDLFDNAMRALRLVPQIILETDNSQTAFALAQKEMAITVYSDMFLKNYSGSLNPNVMLIPLDKYIPIDVLNIFHSADARYAQYKKRYLEMIHQTFS